SGRHRWPFPSPWRPTMWLFGHGRREVQPTATVSRGAPLRPRAPSVRVKAMTYSRLLPFLCVLFVAAACGDKSHGPTLICSEDAVQVGNPGDIQCVIAKAVIEVR